MAYFHGIDTTHYYSDTAFSVTQLNDSTVDVYGYRLRYSDSLFHTHSTSGYLIDTANYIWYTAGNGYQMVGSHDFQGLRINRHNDSLMLIIESGGLGGRAGYVFQSKLH